MLNPELTGLIAEASDAYAPSQADLAAEIGVQPLALTTWRRGRSRPTAEHLRGMADALKRRSDRLRTLAARLEVRAAEHGKLTRPRRGAGARDRRMAETFASRMAAAGEGRVLRIVFYGSRARGAPRSPASDWDFLVVLRDGTTDLEMEERRLKEAALGGAESWDEAEAPVLDVWLMQAIEWDAARILHGHAARTADREGVVLYAAE